jgi:hypothetical protein
MEFLFGEIWIQNVRDVDFLSDFKDSKKFPKKPAFGRKNQSRGRGNTWGQWHNRPH